MGRATTTRRAKAKPSAAKSETAPLTVVDLFSGAGGLSLGFHRAGFKTLLAVDHFGAATTTFEKNLGGPVVNGEISEATELPHATVIAGGPPCQGFSSAGLRRLGDERNTLVSVFANLIAKTRPMAFLFENVEGFLTGENGDRVLDLLAPLVRAGYQIHLRKVNVANFGVPQHRKRVIAIGGLGWDPGFPRVTHNAFGAPGALHVADGMPSTPTLLDALAGLPSASETAPGEPQGHFHERLRGADLTRVRELKPGQTMRDLPEKLWHESYRRRANRRVMDGMPTEKRGGAPCGLRRLRGDEPSKAITGGARNEFVHPTENRYLTVRECARVQTFPDDFEFIGTESEQNLLVGNAVPPAFGEQLARHLAVAIGNAQPNATSPGALLSFVPTSSEGMSPALQRITERVRSAFRPRAPVEGAEQLRLWA